jgi:molybdopterin molybdotransferase
MIAFEEAQRRIGSVCAPLGAEDVPLAEAVGRVLAATLRSDADLVPFARSAMDGYAVRAADTARSPMVLPVCGAVYAGAGETFAHAAGTATVIATGAPIPPGADAVLPMEVVLRENGVICVGAAVVPGSHVFPAGEDARVGDELAAAGTLLRPSTLGLLAAAGFARVPVFRRPRVAVVTTGDELVDLGRAPGPGQIRNSNATVVSATAAALGATVVAVDRIGDDADALRAALASAASSCDLLITTGGASVGERDLVKQLLREEGCSFAFESVALRPAKPTAFGSLGAARVAVLPGNPSSAFVALHELARPALLALAGRTDTRLPRVRAVLAGRVHGKAERTYAAYATLRIEGAGFVAAPLANQCSALTRTAADADGFIVVSPGRREYVTGDQVAVDVFEWSRVGSAQG